MTDQATTRKEREFARHHREILKVATELFADNGYHQTTMQMIAERAEFSVGHLYKHFSGKEQMYGELVEYHFRMLDEMMAQAEGEGGPPLDRLRNSYELVCEHFNHHPNFMRIYHEEIGGDICSIEERKAAKQAALEKELRAALDAGQLRDHDPALLAAAMQGATKELFRVFAQRTTENPFDPLPAFLFSLFIDPLRTSAAPD